MVIVYLLLFFAIYAGLSFIEAWFLMIFAGAVHHDVFVWVPALGIWESWLVMGLLSAIFSPIAFAIHSSSSGSS